MLQSFYWFFIIILIIIIIIIISLIMMISSFNCSEVQKQKSMSMSFYYQ